MKIDAKLLNELTEQAKVNPRLRQNYDLRTSPADQSQRMLNALEPGTYIPIHRHTASTEVVVVLRGKGIQYLYDANGYATGAVPLDADAEEANSTDAIVPCRAMVVEVGQWHRLEASESGTVIFEAKDGPFKPLSSDDTLSEEKDIIKKLKDFIEVEQHSLSMEIFSSQYIYRMWGGQVPLEQIDIALQLIEKYKQT